MRPGTWVACGLVAAALAADVVLLRRGHEPVSTCVRSSRVGRVAAGVLGVHLVATIPGDPLTWAASRIRV